MVKTKFESFLDGLCNIWVLDKNRKPKPVIKNVRFQMRVVGAKRNFLAEQAGYSIELLIRIPKNSDIAKGAFVTIEDKQYRVIQVQHILDTIPKCTDITLGQSDLLLSFDETEAGTGGRY